MGVLLVLAVLGVDGGSEPGALRIRAVGDVMMGSSVPEGHLPPDEGAALFASVAALLEDADVTFANLEGPLCDSGTSSKCKKAGKCFAFRTPTTFTRHLAAAGVDVVSTANNHAADFGEPCRRETEAALEAHHIAWSGPPGTVAHLAARGKSVELIAFHTSGLTNDVNDIAGAVDLVRRSAGRADLVVVSFHGGAEGPGATRVRVGGERYLGENRGDLRAFARAVVDAGADLVLGHGPHVLRGMEVYRDRLIAYSLGNFATYGRFDLRGLLGVSAVLEARLAEDGRFLGGLLIPTRQVDRGVPVPDPSGKALELVRRLSRDDFGPTAVEVGDDGTLSPPKDAPPWRRTR